MDKSLESVLSSITSSPELMSKISEAVKAGGADGALADVISLISPLVSGDQESEKVKNEEKELPKSETDSAKSTVVASLGKSIAKNAGLLIALKPYLSKERCQMIDGIIKISQLADIIKLV